jgi:hypothetical protein
MPAKNPATRSGDSAIAGVSVALPDSGTNLEPKVSCRVLRFITMVSDQRILA